MYWAYHNFPKDHSKVIKEYEKCNQELVDVNNEKKYNDIYWLSHWFLLDFWEIKLKTFWNPKDWPFKILLKMIKLNCDGFMCYFLWIIKTLYLFPILFYYFNFILKKKKSHFQTIKQQTK